ncbi:MAG: LacI family DNA-binding transcriptional regulator [Meiothermus sp.]|uniref:LacI family DNA-binding transcriptional regulator n=1 Tax=Meiothermus sp. TaxID=1955249 RepID=UPI00298F19DD|nr:LacI family DNA-binding transcriptional regulator [Meiothermus sp.]MDW8092006.1 LacI family DNA-binding transcriptional regulator [Meiothermus sp.]MDW8426406.1 LacI family DNA-binding transcriptional regulator [Meiothermus sp.]
MPTIRDVARLAGVSIATVSNALSGGRHVSPQVREAVLAAVRELGYVPNRLARSLRNRRSQTIGLIVPDITNPFFSSLVKSIEQAARARGYQVLLCSSEEDALLEYDLALALISRQVDGMIVIPTQDAPRYLQRIGEKTPVVLLDRIGGEDGLDRVGVDNLQAARRGTEYLLSQGHRRILLLISTLELANIRERVEGYQAALEAAGIGFDERWVVPCGRGADTARVVEKAIQKYRPSAIFAATNRLSLVAVQAIRNLNLPFPERISLLGFDDFEWSTLLQPYLSTVRQPLEEMGQRAIQLLLERLEGVRSGPARVLLPCELAVRESVAPVALSMRRKEVRSKDNPGGSAKSAKP